MNPVPEQVTEVPEVSESAVLERRAARARTRLLRSLDAIHARRGRLQEAIRAAEWGGRLALVVVVTLATAVVTASAGRRGRRRLLAAAPDGARDDASQSAAPGLVRTVLLVAAALGGFLAAKRVQHRRVAHGL